MNESRSSSRLRIWAKWFSLFVVAVVGIPLGMWACSMSGGAPPSESEMEEEQAADEETESAAAEEAAGQDWSDPKETGMLEPIMADPADFDGFPWFPWPPPRPSALEVLDLALLELPPDPMLATVDSILADELEAAGYSGIRYYRVPEGFAAVTRIEQIHSDGTPRPEPDRWASDPLPPGSLREFLRGLFQGNPGRYRVFVFPVTSRSFAPDTVEVTREEASAWLEEGFNVLPSVIGRRAFTPRHRISALVYEFEQPAAGEAAVQSLPSGVPALDHLERSGLFSRRR